jgi:WD40 repeat protein
MTPDGKLLVSSGTGNGMAYTDPAKGVIVKTVRVDREFGTPLGFSADGKRGVGTGFQGAFVWDTGTGKVVARVARPLPGSDAAAALSADGKRLAVGGTKSFAGKEKENPPTAVVWDVDAGKELATITPAQNDTVFVALSPDGKRLATWGHNYDRAAKEPPRPADDPGRMIQFWDAATGKEVARARVLTGYSPVAVAFSPDGTTAATSGADGAVHLLDPASGAAKGILLGRARQGRRLAFSPDGTVLAAGGDDGSVQRWSLPAGRRIDTTEAPFSQAYAPRGIHFLDAGRAVAWGQRGSVTFVWEVPSGKLVSPAGAHVGSVAGAGFPAGGKEVLTSGSDGTVIRWDAATGRELGTLQLKVPGGGFGAGVVTLPVTLSPDGSRGLASDSSGGIGVYDLPAGNQQFVIPGDPSRQSTGSFSPDGGKVVQILSSFDTMATPPRVAVWDVAVGTKLGDVELAGLANVSAAVTPNGKALVAAGIRQQEKGGTKEVVLTSWDLPTGRKLGSFVAPAGFGPVAVAALGDNTSAVVAGLAGPPAVVNVATGEMLRDLELPRDRRVGGNPVASPDGRTVAVPLAPTFGPNPTSAVAIVAADTGKLRKTLDGTTGNLSVVAFSPDGKTLITGSYDTTALVWDLSGP